MGWSHPEGAAEGGRGLWGGEEIVGRSPALLAALERAQRAAADGSCTVLLSGETGTGKEMVARAIHRASVRRHLPFVAVNCASLAPELADSLLFGHRRGAFTDAVRDSRGIFVEADGGTVFLDETHEFWVDYDPHHTSMAAVHRALEQNGYRNFAVSW